MLGEESTFNPGWVAGVLVQGVSLAALDEHCLSLERAVRGATVVCILSASSLDTLHGLCGWFRGGQGAPRQWGGRHREREVCNMREYDLAHFCKIDASKVVCRGEFC